MSMEQLLAEMWAQVMPLLIVLCLISGFVGALACVVLGSALLQLEEKLMRKVKAKRWAKAQAAKEALSCGDDAAGRACETGGGSSA